MICRARSLVFGVALLAATGCASTRPYREAYRENLTFSSPGLEGSFLRSTKVSLNIFFADDPCQKHYQGSIVLTPSDGPRRIGLPTDRYVYARIFTKSHSWLANRTKTRTHEFRFRPRSGYVYAVEYTHRKKAYGTKLTQTKLATGHTTELRAQEWEVCRAS